MDWRTLAVMLTVLFSLGPPLLGAEFLADPPSGSPAIPTPVFLFLLWFMVWVGAALVILAIYLYIRLEPHRTVLRLVAAFIVYLVFLTWWVGPPGVGSAREPMSRVETRFVRVSAILFLFYLLAEIDDILRRFMEEKQ